MQEVCVREREGQTTVFSTCSLLRTQVEAPIRKVLLVRGLFRSARRTRKQESFAERLALVLPRRLLASVFAWQEIRQSDFPFSPSSAWPLLRHGSGDGASKIRSWIRLDWWPRLYLGARHAASGNLQPAYQRFQRKSQNPDKHQCFRCLRWLVGRD